LKILNKLVQHQVHHLSSKNVWACQGKTFENPDKQVVPHLVHILAYCLQNWLIELFLSNLRVADLGPDVVWETL
jgi:hypothetical protein